MSFYRRRLPHIHPAGKWLFVTWHLDGSLPQALFPPPGKSTDGRVFVWMDRYLDTTRKGPQYLVRPEIAARVARSIQRGVSLGQYELRAWVVMANQVHVLLLPLISPRADIQCIIANTARETYLILDSTF